MPIGSEVPYVGAKYTNGGVVSWTKYNSSLISEGNSIIFINDGDGSVGYSLYKQEDFIGTVNISVGTNSYLNQYSGLFISTCSNLIRSKYSFGYKRNVTKLKSDKIKLPITSDNQPNWGYMEQYIINLMGDIEIPELEPLSISPISLNDIGWKEFELHSIFDILSGVRLTSSDMKKGTIPFIGATDKNNGITNWISDKNNSTDKNVLGVNYNGSVGEVFYHFYEATFSDDVKRLKLKNTHHRNAMIYLFIKTLILQQKTKYQYGYKFNSNRMKKQKILLPVTAKGTPAWQFMEEYIKSMSNKNLI